MRPLTLQAGSLLSGRYRLESCLGEGGMGEVWSATHVVTGGMVAIKRLRCPRHDAEFAEARARFLLEARSACAAEHPNVVRVFDVIEAENEAPFIVMELLEGETLAQRLAREGALTPLETARVLLPVVSAVGSAHVRGIVHRDLKPANIFLADEQGAPGTASVKVLDFGIAKWLGQPPSDGAVRTQTGSTLGTPAYMSPEQALGERSIDHRADVWSLGVILYECLSGARPVDGANPAQMLMHLLSSGIIPIEHLVPELPAGWAPVMAGALRREVAHRLADLRPLYAALAAVSDRPSPAFEAPGGIELEGRATLGAEPEQPSPVGPDIGSAVAPSSWASPTRSTASAPPASRARAPNGLPTLLGLFLGLAVVAPVVAAVWPAGDANEAGQAVLEPPAGSRAAGPASAPPAAMPGATPPGEEAASPAMASSRSEAATSPSPAEPPAALGSPASLAGGGVSPAPSARRGSRPRAPPPLRASPERAPPLPAGAGCEQSAQCKSRLCVAYVCR